MEEQLKLFVEEHKEITTDALKNFLNSFQTEKKFVFEKKDPRKHSRVIKREYDPNDVDDVALLHIENSAKYVHDLRREKR